MRIPQHYGHCEKVTETLLHWMESRPCVRCGRDIRMVEPLCERRSRCQMVVAHYRERADRRDDGGLGQPASEKQGISYLTIPGPEAEDRLGHGSDPVATLRGAFWRQVDFAFFGRDTPPALRATGKYQRQGRL